MPSYNLTNQAPHTERLAHVLRTIRIDAERALVLQAGQEEETQDRRNAALDQVLFVQAQVDDAKKSMREAKRSAGKLTQTAQAQTKELLSALQDLVNPPAPSSSGRTGQDRSGGLA